MEMEEEDFDVYGVDETISDMGSTDSMMSEWSNSSEAGNSGCSFNSDDDLNTQTMSFMDEEESYFSEEDEEPSNQIGVSQ